MPASATSSVASAIEMNWISGSRSELASEVPTRWWSACKRLESQPALCTTQPRCTQGPKHNARGFSGEVEHPVVGTEPLMRSPWSIESTESQYSAAPTLGQHNDQVFRVLLDVSEVEVAELRAEGVTV